MTKVIRIGRHSKNDIVINDMLVGRSVLAIIVDDNGDVYAQDLKSTNGVYINKKRIYGKVKLHSDDIVRIGNTTLPWQEYIKGIVNNMNYEFKQCANGHYYQGDECPYCKAQTAKEFKLCSKGHYYQGDECPYCKDNTLIIKKAIRMMIDKEKTPYQVREYLVNDCYFTYESADSLIADISNWQEQYDADSKSANNDIVIGLLWVIGGSLVTAITFVAANGGGRYVITYGAIVFGLLQFIAGVILKLRLIHSKNKLINEFNNNR